MRERTIIRMEQTSARTGFSRSQIARLEKRGDFPQRVQLTEWSIGHYEDEVEAWVHSRVRKGGRRSHV
jgi:predicted DNA-binding transcriptional regulator AlpA